MHSTPESWFLAVQRLAAQHQNASAVRDFDGWTCNWENETPEKAYYQEFPEHAPAEPTTQETLKKGEPVEQAQPTSQAQLVEALKIAREALHSCEPVKSGYYATGNWPEWSKAVDAVDAALVGR